MKNIMRLVFVIVAMFLCVCSEIHRIEMKKSPCALKDLNNSFLRGTHV
ncbi:type IV secretion system protein VirB7 [Helicobacter pylori]|nr:type IV secretion system protein VirB7 [Helicobacter pylori]WJI92220.1 type IV secretion system protein VirB7 [Helicobacter pylori]